LIENIDAVLILFDEPLETANLPFDSSQALLDGRLIVNVPRLCHATPFVFREYTPWWYTFDAGKRRLV